MSAIPDRSKEDTEIAQSLLIFAAHHALIAENQRLAAQADDLTHSLARVTEQLEAAEGLSATLRRERADYRRQLALLQVRLYGEWC